MTLNRVAIPSPFYSSRGGVTVTTIVIHTAEGATNIYDLGGWFQNPSAQVSSHVGIDDTPGTIGEYVQRSGKAWTQANANPYSVSAELCAFAAWDSAEWDRHPDMLANTAAWIAEEAAYFGIPLVALTASGAQNPNTRGVCEHVDLGSMGGGHVDCGPNFPLQHVIDLAGGATPAPPPEPEEPEMVIIQSPKGEMSMFDGTRKIGLVDTASAGAFQAAGIKTANISQNQYDRIPVA